MLIKQFRVALPSHIIRLACVLLQKQNSLCLQEAKQLTDNFRRACRVAQSSTHCAVCVPFEQTQMGYMPCGSVYKGNPVTAVMHVSLHWTQYTILAGSTSSNDHCCKQLRVHCPPLFSSLSLLPLGHQPLLHSPQGLHQQATKHTHSVLSFLSQPHRV